MIAIYKKELKQYFCSMTGVVFLAFFLVIAGIYTWAYNISGGYGNFELTLGSITFLFVILMPILTMRLMAEEKHQNTDQLLLTSPVSRLQIVMGKYFAVLTLFSIGIGIVALYPLIINHYGQDIRLAMAYSSLIGFYLLGAANIAVGMFISSLTESQIIAAVLSFITFLLSYLMTSISAMLPSEALPQCILFAVAWLILCVVAHNMMQSKAISISLFVIGEVVIWGIYLLKAEVYQGLFSEVLNVLAISSRFSDFELGILNYDAIVYYISVIAVFLFLTVQVVKKQFQSGIYSSFLSVLVVAIAVVGNMLFASLELSTDLSSQKMFSLSKSTKEALKDINQDVKIYYLVEDGSEFTYIDKVLKQYPKVSEHIEIEKVDPVVNPAFASQYTEAEVTSNDVIIVNEKTEASVHIPYTDMYYANTDYTTYTSTEYLDVEGQVTAGLQNVLSEVSVKMYVLSGHNEITLGNAMTEALDKMNIETEELTLYSTEEGVPEDCDILLLNGPANDISDLEKEKILEYLKSGGDAIINVEYTEQNTPNLKEVLEYYGVKEQMGMICETAQNYYNYINVPIPVVNTESEITSDIANLCIMPYAVGLSVAEAPRETITATTLLSSSDGSYLKVNPSSGDGMKETGDIDGPFALGIEAIENLGEEETRLVVYASASAFADDFTSTGQFSNAVLFKNAVASMSGSEVEKVSVDAKSLSYSYISVPVMSQMLWAAVLVVILPLGILGAGTIVWMIRRRK